MKYAAIDFETACYMRASACSLGIVVSDGERVTDTWYRLIRPPRMIFDTGCIAVNHILPKMVEDEPEFPAFWRDIASRLEGSVVFAHNAGFDTAVLSAMLDWYGLPDIRFRYGCTVKLSRALWPKLVNHKLDTVAGALSFSFEHHQALADAAACEWIVRKAIEQTDAKSIHELMKKTGQRLTPFHVARTKPETEWKMGK